MSKSAAIGLYICGCHGGISDALDTKKLAEHYAKNRKVKICRQYECLCEGEGLELLRNDLKQGLVDRIVVAGCTPFIYNEVFRATLRDAALNEYMLERCNLREQCVWGHKDELPEKLFKKAVTLINMSLAKVELLQPVKSLEIKRIGKKLTVDPFYPVRDSNKCDNCGRCEAECPFKAWQSTPEGMQINLNKCRQCGICQGGCPVKAISLTNCGIDQVSAMLETIDPEFAGSDEPVVIAFLCGNDAYPAVDAAGEKSVSYPPNIIPIMVPCVGAVSPSWVADAFTNGVDGILIAGCKKCSHGKGNSLTATRMEKTKEIMNRMFLEPERLQLTQTSKDNYEGFIMFANDYVKELKKMGPSPLK